MTDTEFEKSQQQIRDVLGGAHEESGRLIERSDELFAIPENERGLDEAFAVVDLCAEALRLIGSDRLGGQGAAHLARQVVRLAPEKKTDD
jgi:hypothetical protein